MFSFQDNFLPKGYHYLVCRCTRSAETGLQENADQKAEKFSCEFRIDINDKETLKQWVKDLHKANVTLRVKRTHVVAGVQLFYHVSKLFFLFIHVSFHVLQ